jgi:flagellar protein FliO/FliZ
MQAQAQTEAKSTAAMSPAEIAVLAPEANATASATTAVEAPKKDLKETEIPVQLEPTKKAAGSESSVFRFILSFSIIGALGCAAYFLLRKYKFSNSTKSQATQIKVLSQHYLGPKKSLAIVRVAGESVLIGITDHNISMIKSLSLLDEDIPEETPREFHSIFSRNTQAEAQAPVVAQDNGDSKDDFSISGIKDFVSVKLKNMRSLE